MKMNAVQHYPRTGKRGVPQQFPRRLYEMLESQSSSSKDMNENENTAIAWSDSGRAFHISDVSLFASKVLPKYFRTSKFSSFQRNLNLYGFTKIRRGPDADMYSNPSFIKGRPELLSDLRKIPNASHRKQQQPAPAPAPPPLSDKQANDKKPKQQVDVTSNITNTILPTFISSTNGPGGILLPNHQPSTFLPTTASILFPATATAATTASPPSSPNPDKIASNFGTFILGFAPVTPNLCQQQQQQQQQQPQPILPQPQHFLHTPTQNHQVPPATHEGNNQSSATPSNTNLVVDADTVHSDTESSTSTESSQQPLHEEQSSQDDDDDDDENVATTRQISPKTSHDFGGSKLALLAFAMTSLAERDSFIGESMSIAHRGATVQGI